MRRWPESAGPVGSSSSTRWSRASPPTRSGRCSRTSSVTTCTMTSGGCSCSRPGSRCWRCGWDVLLRAGANWWGWRAPWDPAGLPWLAIVVGALGLVTAPFVNAVSRRVERQADDFALELTGDAMAFIGAMERLADLNLAERKPHRLKELLLYSHPSIERRILAARSEEHTSELQSQSNLVCRLLLEKKKESRRLSSQGLGNIIMGTGQCWATSRSENGSSH